MRFVAIWLAVTLADGAAHLLMFGNGSWVFAPVWIAVGLAAALTAQRSRRREDDPAPKLETMPRGHP